MKKVPRTYSPGARWGLLITTLALGAVLVAISLTGYLGARETGEAVVRARGMDLLYLVQRSIMLAGELEEGMLNDVVADSESQGLRGASVVEPSGELVASAGVSSGSFGRLPAVRRGESPVFEIDWSQESVRAVAPLAFGFGRFCSVKGGGRCCGSGCRGGCGTGAGMKWGRRRLVLEFEPVVAGGMISRAAWTFGISLAAAGLLLLVALVFFRLSRRAELIQGQLEKERKLAALGEMSAVLGHELRNPIASLKGHAQLLAEKLPGDHPGRPGAETVVREVSRLEELTGQVLDFVRTGELQREPTSPEEVARAAVAQVGSERIRLEVGSPLSPCPLDRVRMQQVLVNLLSNALHAGEEGSPVDLFLGREDGQLLFKVRDRGPGLAAGDGDKVFEPFYTGRVKGTGLGLTVARRIVEGHGGTIRVENHPEGGAVFTVRLPAG
jgi:two-component system sensor histidine kinase HydH